MQVVLHVPSFAFLLCYKMFTLWFKGNEVLLCHQCSVCWAVLGSPWLLALSTALSAARLNEGRGGLSRGCWSSRAPIKTFWSYKISMRWLLFPDGFIPF